MARTSVKGVLEVHENWRIIHLPTKVSSSQDGWVDGWQFYVAFALSSCLIKGWLKSLNHISNGSWRDFRSKRQDSNPWSIKLLYMRWSIIYILPSAFHYLSKALSRYSRLSHFIYNMSCYCLLTIIGVSPSCRLVAHSLNSHSRKTLWFLFYF